MTDVGAVAVDLAEELHVVVRMRVVEVGGEHCARRFRGQDANKTQVGTEVKLRSVRTLTV